MKGSRTNLQTFASLPALHPVGLTVEKEVNQVSFLPNSSLCQVILVKKIYVLHSISVRV